MSPRRAGVLVHPTSLPSRYGIGDAGPEALRFLAWASEAGQTVWQILPLYPTIAGHSPYNAASSFAGNPLLVSPDALSAEGWLAAEDLAPTADVPEDRVSYERAIPRKLDMLRRSWRHFARHASPEARCRLDEFVEHPDQQSWLEDWVLFAALKDAHEGRGWLEWDAELRRREPSALRRARRRLSTQLRFQRYVQFVFSRQWSALVHAGRARGVSILGDLPFYVSHDSADVWSRQELFQLDGRGWPTRVAGVPPDCFSETGQLWGNPIFDWRRMAEDSYAWWIERLRRQLRLADAVRLDHFRAFAAYWEVDAGRTTAVEGRWVPDPGRALFEAARASLGDLPLIAEDLGTITDDVRDLRRSVGLAGMRILQFAFGDGHREHLPEHHTEDSVVYTGTHDNDTTRGWLEKLPSGERAHVLEFLRASPQDAVWRLIETGYESIGRLAVVPLQDAFELGSEARMNHPGQERGNWRWRAEPRRFTSELAARLRALAGRTGRLAG